MRKEIMKIIGILQWEASHKAVALCYAANAAALATKVADTEIAAGSIAYTGDAKTYVFNGTQWVER